jgi:hypothetical protein
VVGPMRNLLALLRPRRGSRRCRLEGSLHGWLCYHHSDCEKVVGAVVGPAGGPAASDVGSRMVVVLTNSKRKVAQRSRCCMVVIAKVAPALIGRRKNQATSARRIPSGLDARRVLSVFQRPATR